MSNRNLITAGELNERLQRDRETLSVLDASWYLPTQNRDAKAEFMAGRIPGAQYFDIDRIADRDNPLPHMMPSASQFARQASELGIRESDSIVVYDGAGIFSCARAWWMFKTMGAERVQILEGGFKGWKKAGFAIETGPPETPRPVKFHANFTPDRIATLEDILSNLESGRATVLDARSTERFEGTAPEPREGLRSGHIPGSLSLPFQALTQDGTLKPEQELVKIFSELGIAQQTPIITSCGSGVTAAVIALALDTIGHKNHSLYDGSWSEWGLNPDVPVETGSNP